MKISPETLKQVEAAYKAYEQEVDSSGMTVAAKNTYLLHVRQFIKWLKGDFHPGARKNAQ